MSSAQDNDAALGVPSNAPGATLLIPYFQVNLKIRDQQRRTRRIAGNAKCGVIILCRGHLDQRAQENSGNKVASSGTRKAEHGGTSTAFRFCKNPAFTNTLMLAQ